MRKDEHARGTDKPKERAEWRRPPKEGQTNDKKSRIKGLLRYNVVADLHWLRGLCDVAKKGQKRLEGGGGKGKGKDYSPHLLIAVKPPMRKPSEMSSNGFVILNRITVRKRRVE